LAFEVLQKECNFPKSNVLAAFVVALRTLAKASIATKKSRRSAFQVRCNNAI
jgi:hypothetical protein